MRNLLYFATVLAIMGLVFWAYRENYATQHAIKQEAALQRQITRLKEGIGMQRAEWAYLNRPERLRALALLNYDKLKLMPMLPEQFADVSEIPYPKPTKASDAGSDQDQSPQP